VHITLDAAAISAIFTGLVALMTGWNTITLARVHTLTNNTLTQNIAAKDAATLALAESQATNRALLAQLATGRRVDEIKAITIAAQSAPQPSPLPVHETPTPGDPTVTDRP
jgi:hypothetical protein